MIIYFLRHASAGQKKSNAAQDEKRPLDKEGIEQCRYMGRVLANMDVQVDAIISSPFKRATQTASLVGNELGYDSKILRAPKVPGPLNPFWDARAGKPGPLQPGHRLRLQPLSAPGPAQEPASTRQPLAGFFHDVPPVQL